MQSTEEIFSKNESDATPWACVMDYSFPSAAWSDCSSTIALSWPDHDKSGLQYLHSLRIHGGVAVTDRLLDWKLIENGVALDLNKTATRFYPHLVAFEEHASEIALNTRIAWVKSNTLALEFKINNRSSSERALTLAFDYEAKAKSNTTPNGDNSGRVTIESGREVYYRPKLSPLESDPEGSWLAVIDFEKDASKPVPESYEIAGETYPVFCITDLKDRNFVLQPESSTSIHITMALGHRWGETRQNYDSAKDCDFDIFKAAEDRVQALFDGAPAIESEFSDDPALDKLYQQAIFGLNSLYIPGEGGLTGTKRVPWTCKHVLAGGYFWDTAFTSSGGVLINPEAAKESIEAFCEHVNSRGAMPANLTDLAMGGEGQFPIMNWGAWNIYKRTNDLEWLSRCLPALESYVDHWFNHFCRDYGLCYIYNSHLGNDDDVRFDYCMKGLYNQPVDKIDSPDINATLVVELEVLGLINEELGLVEKAKKYFDRSKELNQKIVDHFYFEEEKAFLDTEEGTREIKSGVITPHMFLPLWAETPLAEEKINEIIETHMLDPDKFYREHPFPSIPFNHEEYDPEGYWRGRIWPHMVFWMCQTLWLHGYEEESTTVARNLLKMMLKTPWICENYNSETGIGWSAETNRGWPAYNWCYATVILLMSGKHKSPPLL